LVWWGVVGFEVGVHVLRRHRDPRVVVDGRRRHVQLSLLR
jgi:hypothetical protein